MEAQIKEIDRKLDEILKFLKEKPKRSPTKPKVEIPEEAKTFKGNLKLYIENFNSKFTKGPLYCSYMKKGEEVECSGKVATHILLGKSDGREPVEIDEDKEKFYNLVVKKYGDDPRKSFSKIRSNAHKKMQLKDSANQCELMILGDISSAKEGASSPLTIKEKKEGKGGKGTKNQKGGTLIKEIIHTDEYTDNLKQLENETYIVTRTKKGKRTPVIIGKYPGDKDDIDNKDYLELLEDPSDEDLKISNLTYDDEERILQLAKRKGKKNNDDEGEDDGEEGEEGEEDDELNDMLKNFDEKKK